jgi:hypothetical protein
MRESVSERLGKRSRRRRKRRGRRKRRRRKKVCASCQQS